jgi:hypothetical protein
MKEREFLHYEIHSNIHAFQKIIRISILQSPKVLRSTQRGAYVSRSLSEQSDSIIYGTHIRSDGPPFSCGFLR